MTTNVQAVAAWELASQGRAKLEELSPQTQYAVRRIGGPARLRENLAAFTRAWNESPVVDADEDTGAGEILVRPLEPKDGIR